MILNNRSELRSLLSKEFAIYFPEKKFWWKCFLLREHEYYIWEFQKLLRKEEYYKQRKKVFSRAIVRLRKNRLAAKLGFLINPGIADEGLHIWHYGSVIINGYSRIGKNCILHGRNCIGNKGGTGNECPIIGDNVDIGVGASILGGVKIANGITIGAGAVVVNSFEEEGIILGGVPARKIGEKNEYSCNV